jgi:hypothetical protein
MSQWTPEWLIKINGSTVTNVTLSNLSITSGRTDIFSQPQAGYCSLQLLNLNNDNTLTFQVNKQLTIEIKDSAGTFVPIFGGWISDSSTFVQNAGSTGLTTIINITAIGAIAKLQKIDTLGVLAKEFEGDQIYQLLSDNLQGAWTDVSPAQTWAAYDPSITWANAENQGVGDIDLPGAYEMMSRASNNINLYSLITNIAESALGYIFEDANGNIGYADTYHRINYLAANGYIDLDANHALWSGIRTSRRIGDVRNKLRTNYGSSGSSVYVSENLSSQATYGVYQTTATSLIDKVVDVEDVADRYIQMRANPYDKFETITFALGNDEIDDADRDDLLNVFMGMPIQIINLPDDIAGGTFQGFVEGWTFQASYNGLSVAINASPLAFNTPVTRWQDVSAAESWSTITNTLTWLNAYGTVA